MRWRFLIPPLLVVDANVLFAALLKNATARKILLLDLPVLLFSPQFVQEEISHHRIELSARLGIGSDAFNTQWSDLLASAQISIIPLQKYSEFLSNALDIAPDRNDADYFALALKLQCPIWSNDKALKKQIQVKVYSTHELVKEWNQEPIQ